jgi:hypothetical protein
MPDGERTSLPSNAENGKKDVTTSIRACLSEEVGGHEEEERSSIAASALWTRIKRSTLASTRALRYLDAGPRPRTNPIGVTTL